MTIISVKNMEAIFHFRGRQGSICPVSVKIREAYFSFPWKTRKHLSGFRENQGSILFISVEDKEGRLPFP
jgi:hypothetical protein